MSQQKELVLARCDSFVDLQIWPPSHTLDPRGWLSNFTHDELPYALSLLNAFVFYSEPLVDRLFDAAFMTLRLGLRERDGSRSEIETELNRTCFTFVTGERPSATDSGHIFARKVRQVLGIPEEQIFYPDEAIRRLCLNQFDNVVFVDDFVGSGDQFIATWTREYMGVHGISFGSLSSIRSFYIPLIGTDYGLDRLRNECPQVAVYPTYALPDRLNALSPNSVVWPAEQRSGAVDFLRTVSSRAGCSGKGYHGLGFQIAFYHSVPDATLPIFWHDNNGWKPLIRRA